MHIVCIMLLCIEITYSIIVSSATCIQYGLIWRRVDADPLIGTK